MITWDAVRDYLRLALACAGFAFIDPGISKTLDWAPFPVPQMVSVLISALISYLLFAFINPTTRLTITWTDLADKVAVTGPGLDVPIRDDGRGRIYGVEVERSSRTRLGRWLFRKMVEQGLELVLDWNQPQLRLVVERSETATGDGSSVHFKLGAPEHRTSVSAADISVNGAALYADQVSATLRHSVKTAGRWSRVCGFLVRAQPSIRSVRMIKV